MGKLNLSVAVLCGMLVGCGGGSGGEEPEEEGFTVGVENGVLIFEEDGVVTETTIGQDAGGNPAPINQAPVSQVPSTDVQTTVGMSPAFLNGVWGYCQSVVDGTGSTWHLLSFANGGFVQRLALYETSFCNGESVGDIDLNLGGISIGISTIAETGITVSELNLSLIHI